MFLFINSCVKEILKHFYTWFPFNIYQGYEFIIPIIYFAKNCCKNNNLFSRMEEISLSSIELPAAKNTATREREDNIVETEEELGIFQLLDRLEEVTSMLTSRWQESKGSMVVALTETFRYLELCSTCLKEGLGCSKPATNLRTSTLTHCVGFLLYYLTEPSSIE